jgi:hypothetical protein
LDTTFGAFEPIFAGLQPVAFVQSCLPEPTPRGIFPVGGNVFRSIDIHRRHNIHSLNRCFAREDSHTKFDREQGFSMAVVK